MTVKDLLKNKLYMNRHIDGTKFIFININRYEFRLFKNRKDGHWFTEHGEYNIRICQNNNIFSEIGYKGFLEKNLK